MAFKDNKPYHIEELPDLEVKVRSGDNIVAVVNIKEQIQEMQSWCHQTNCGKRMSFDVFKFDSSEQKMMFILRWSV